MSLLDPFADQLSPASRHVGETAARRLFARRGDHAEAHLTELELAAVVAAAVQGVLSLLNDHAALAAAIQASGRAS